MDMAVSRMLTGSSRLELFCLLD
uniref:Uncharacterized protein n=1 Tax=Anguilla anguilla TaxID=7936 RepID=A0A0E9VB92_ANGAN